MAATRAGASKADIAMTSHETNKSGPQLLFSAKGACKLSQRLRRKPLQGPAAEPKASAAVIRSADAAAAASAQAPAAWDQMKPIDVEALPASQHPEELLLLEVMQRLAGPSLG